MRASRQQTIGQLRDLGLAEMKPTGSWGLTRDGQNFLDQLDLMRELDGRGAAQPPAERRPSAAGEGRRRRGDDDPAPPRPRAENSS